MKKIFTLLLTLFFVSFSFGQDAEKNVYEVSYLKVKTGFVREFESAFRNHVKSFYKDENKPYLRKVTHGHRSGEYLLITGPIKMSFMDQKNKRRVDDWNKNILSKAEFKDSNLYRNHQEYSSMSKSESGSGKVVFVRGFKQESGKTTFDILSKLKKISDMSEGCNPYNVVTPIAKSKGEPDFYIVRHLSSMGEFDEDDLFDNKNCNVFEMFQKKMSQEEMDNFGQMWQDNFEVVYSQFRIRVD